MTDLAKDSFQFDVVDDIVVETRYGLVPVNASNPVNQIYFSLIDIMDQVQCHRIISIT